MFFVLAAMSTVIILCNAVFNALLTIRVVCHIVIRINSKVFSIFDKYGTKTVKTIEDVVGLIGG